MTQTALQIIKDYHQQSKHQPGRYARAPGYMDWANQPLPYRLYQGAPQIHLPLLKKTNPLPYSALFQTAEKTAESISIESVSSMLELSLGLSAWKEYQGSEWALRINPSSGNLHPTECYLLLPALDQQVAASVHYNPYIHMLEQRAAIPDVPAQALKQTDGFSLMLSSIAWREAWKYGERAYRYCQHDVGHALAALNIACNLNGWQIQVLPNISSEKSERVFALAQSNKLPAETEFIDCVCWVSRTTPDLVAVEQWFDRLPALSYLHPANQLSKVHLDWPIIDQVFFSSHQTPLTLTAAKNTVVINPEANNVCSASAETLIRQRRSAQSYDRASSHLPLNIFLHNLQKTLPGNSVPFSVLPFEAQLDLVLFVHNVQELQSGLYIWVRNETHLPLLKAQMDSDFEWTEVIKQQPLYLLQGGDFRNIAKTVSCNQDIAGDSAFSLAMLANFTVPLQKSPSCYPSLYWESGLIGQVLYLQAEAFGLRGTGIGCFFDDQVHQLLGLKDDQWQSLYHFTVGKAIDDLRIASKPAYFHLKP